MKSKKSFMKIAILNAKYNPNLGDGAIAECLEHELAKRLPDSEIFSVDISGSEDYGGRTSMTPDNLVSTFSLMPEFLQKTIKFFLRALLLRRRHFRRWQEQLKDCDAIIIGGGQLFMDSQFYFPTRICMTVKAAPKGVPLFVYAVGVSKNFTRTGKRLFEQAFQHGALEYVSVRDFQSQKNWKQHFPNRVSCTNLDPALLAKETYGVKKNNIVRNKHIALGVSDIINLETHADNPDDVVGKKADFYIKLITLLLEEDYAVSLFTNGGDQSYLDKLISFLENHEEVLKKLHIMRRALKPSELIEQIQSADVIVSHRLHANILAYAYQIPSVGLMCDQKVASFFDVTKRQDFLIREDQPHLVLEKVKEALRVGIDEDNYKQVIRNAHNGIDALTLELQKLS